MNVSSRRDSSNDFYYQNKERAVLPRCRYKIAGIGLTISFNVLKFIIKNSPKAVSESLKPIKRKILYRILHNNARLVGLEIAKLFKHYLVQPMRNLPSLKVYDQRNLIGASSIYLNIKIGCFKALEKAPAQQVLKVAKRFQDSEIALFIIESAKAIGVEIDDALSAKENAIKIIEENSLLKLHLIGLVLNKIFLNDIDFNESLDGICGMAISYFASQFFEGKSWKLMTQQFSKGINRTIRDLFSVYDALANQHGSTFKHFPFFNLTSTYVKVQCTVVDQIALKSEKSKKNTLNTILQMEDGVYLIALNWEGKDEGHSLLFHRDGDAIHIIDPNIGYLRADGKKATRLLKKLMDIYSEPDEVSRIDIAKFEHTPTRKRFALALLQQV